MAFLRGFIAKVSVGSAETFCFSLREELPDGTVAANLRHLQVDLGGGVVDAARAASLASLAMLASAQHYPVGVEVDDADPGQVLSIGTNFFADVPDVPILFAARKQSVSPIASPTYVVRSVQYVQVAPAAPLQALLLEDPQFDALFGPLRAALNPAGGTAIDPAFDYRAEFDARNGSTLLRAAVYSDNSSTGTLTIGGPAGSPPTGLLLNEFWLYDSVDAANPAATAGMTQAQTLHWRLRLQKPTFDVAADLTRGEYTNPAGAANLETRLELLVYLDQPSEP